MKMLMGGISILWILSSMSHGKLPQPHFPATSPVAFFYANAVVYHRRTPLFPLPPLTTNNISSRAAPFSHIIPYVSAVVPSLVG